MDSLLNAVSTSRKAPAQDVASARKLETRLTALNNADDVVVALKGQPDLGIFRSVIQFLTEGESHTVDIKIPSSKTAQILALLINEVIPSYWQQITESPTETVLLENIRQCLRSLPALGLIVSRLRVLCKEAEGSSDTGKRGYLESQATTLIALLEFVLRGDDVAREIWDSFQAAEITETQINFFWKESIAILGSGKLVSTASQTEDVLLKTLVTTDRTWLADGKKYTTWLAQNTARLVIAAGYNSSVAVVGATQLLAKSLSIGYTGK